METEKSVFEVLKTVMLSFLDIDAERIQPEAEIASLGLASLDWVEIQIELEMNYGVRVDSSLFTKNKLKTVGELVGHVEGVLGQSRNHEGKI
jgi:acyl carrier protein